MLGDGNSVARHSRLVAWAKIALPLAALVLLSTMFLFSKGGSNTQDIPFADIEDIARDQRIMEPYFAGVSADGTEFAISAQNAAPEPGNLNVLTIETIRATLETTSGTEVLIRAGHGQLDTDARQAQLAGLARLETSNGYQMETTGLMTDLATGRVESLGPLEVHAPYGQLTAGRLILETPEGATGQQMVFNDGVRLVYQQQQ
jgi:lipopolysaccharide export system protein LptC